MYLEFLDDADERQHGSGDEKTLRGRQSLGVRRGSARKRFEPNIRRGGEDWKECPKADAGEGPGEGGC